MVAGEDYRAIKLADFKVDMEELRGRKVAVPGVIQLISGDIAFLSLDATASAIHVSVGTKNLPRELRMMLVTKCVSGCNAVVRGKVGELDIYHPNGIVAESFEVLQ